MLLERPSPKGKGAGAGNLCTRDDPEDQYYYWPAFEEKTLEVDFPATSRRRGV